MKTFTCYICYYFAHAESLPDDFVDEKTHKCCADNMEKWTEYNRPWAEKIAREIVEVDALKEGLTP